MPDPHFEPEVLANTEAVLNHIGVKSVQVDHLLVEAKRICSEASKLGAVWIGLATNQTERLPGAAFSLGGGISVCVQTGCRVYDSSSSPIVEITGSECVSELNSNMTEPELSQFRADCESTQLINVVKLFGLKLLHFVLLSHDSEWERRRCYMFEFSVFDGSYTSYTMNQRDVLRRACGAIPTPAGTVSGLVESIMYELCGPFLGCLMAKTQREEDWNVAANAEICDIIDLISTRNYERVPRLDFERLSMALAHDMAGTRCAYALALGKAGTPCLKVDVKGVEPKDSHPVLWDKMFSKTDLSLVFQSVLFLSVIVIVIGLGNKLKWEADWLASLIAILLHGIYVVQAAKRGYRATGALFAEAVERYGDMDARQASGLLELVVQGRLCVLTPTEGGSWARNISSRGIINIDGSSVSSEDLRKAGVHFIKSCVPGRTLMLYPGGFTKQLQTTEPELSFGEPTLRAEALFLDVWLAPGEEDTEHYRVG